MSAMRRENCKQQCQIRRWRSTRCCPCSHAHMHFGVFPVYNKPQTVLVCAFSHRYYRWGTTSVPINQVILFRRSPSQPYRTGTQTLSPKFRFSLQDRGMAGRGCSFTRMFRCPHTEPFHQILQTSKWENSEAHVGFVFDGVISIRLMSDFPAQGYKGSQGLKPTTGDTDP